MVRWRSKKEWHRAAARGGKAREGQTDTQQIVLCCSSACRGDCSCSLQILYVLFWHEDTKTGHWASEGLQLLKIS